MSADSRERMVKSAAALIGARGLNATSFSDVIAESGAPRGSIYHHFPEGKKQLAEEAIRWTSAQILGYQRACTATTATGVLNWFVDLWRQSLLASGCTAGCPVVGVAINTVAGDGDLIAVVRAAFQSWVALLASQLEAVGIPAPRAHNRPDGAGGDGRGAGPVPGRREQRPAGSDRRRTAAPAAHGQLSEAQYPKGADLALLVRELFPADFAILP